MLISRFKKGVPGFGFDAFGYPLKYDTASEAGCEISRIPEEGLVLSVPLFNNTNVASTGQQMIINNVQFGIDSGIPCAIFDGSGVIYSTESDSRLNLNGGDGTLSLWFKAERDYNIQCIVTIGRDDRSGEAWNIFLRNGSITIGVGGAEDYIDGYDTDRWYHCVCTYSSNEFQLWLQGELAGTGAMNIECKGETFSIGGFYTGGSAFIGNISSVRMYNRVLTDKEIKALAKEFKI